MAADHTEDDDVEAVRPSPHRKRITTPPRSAIHKHSRGMCTGDDDDRDASVSELFELPRYLKKAIREKTEGYR